MGDQPTVIIFSLYKRKWLSIKDDFKIKDNSTRSDDQWKVILVSGIKGIKLWDSTWEVFGGSGFSKENERISKY